MGLKDTRDSIYDLVAEYFTGATVIWIEQMATKPKLPYVTLKLSSPRRDENAIIDDDGKGRAYNVTATLEINVYSQGKKVVINGIATNNYENTAQEDLLEFFNYVDSDMGLISQQSKKIAVNLNPPINDLSSLENDASYRYRSMAEAKVSFVQRADGPYGIAYGQGS